MSQWTRVNINVHGVVVPVDATKFSLIDWFYKYLGSWFGIYREAVLEPDRIEDENYFVGFMSPNGENWLNLEPINTDVFCVRLFDSERKFFVLDEFNNELSIRISRIALMGDTKFTGCVHY